MKKHSSVFEGIFRVYNDKVYNTLNFESRESKKIKSICSGSVHLARFDKVWKHCILIYSKEENLFYFYHNMQNDSGCYLGQKIQEGDTLNIGDKVNLKIFERCICSPIENYYGYLNLEGNGKKILNDGIYFGG